MNNELVHDLDVASSAATAHLIVADRVVDQDLVSIDPSSEILRPVTRGAAEMLKKEEDLNDNTVVDGSSVDIDEDDGGDGVGEIKSSKGKAVEEEGIDDKGDDDDDDDDKSTASSTTSSSSDSLVDMDFALEVSNHLRTANELVNAPGTSTYPITQDDISVLGTVKPEDLVKMGIIVTSVADERVVIVRSEGAVVDEGTVVAIRDGDVENWGEGVGGQGYIVLGKIGEVFGPVAKPLYKVELDVGCGEDKQYEGDDEEIDLDDGQDEPLDASASADPPLASHKFRTLVPSLLPVLSINSSLPCYLVPSSSLTRSLEVETIRLESGKGTDKSDVNDEEGGDEEFSDDEKEIEAKRRRKKGKKGKGVDKGGKGGGERGGKQYFDVSKSRGGGQHEQHQSQQMQMQMQMQQQMYQQQMYQQQMYQQQMHLAHLQQHQHQQQQQHQHHQGYGVPYGMPYAASSGGGGMPPQPAYYQQLPPYGQYPPTYGHPPAPYAGGFGMPYAASNTSATQENAEKDTKKSKR